MKPTKKIIISSNGADSDLPAMTAVLTKADGTVVDPTNPTLGEKSVTTDMLQDQAVTFSKMGSDSVGEAQLLPNAVVTNNIKDGAVTKAKIAAGVIPTVPGAATATALGLVKKAATLANATNAAGDAPTAAEFNALVLKFNNLLAQLKAAGIMS